MPKPLPISEDEDDERNMSDKYEQRYEKYEVIFSLILVYIFT